MPACRYLVRGTVQGVGYRYFALREANALGLAGFARNLGDGSVEVVAEGAEQALSDLEHRLRAGPVCSEVTAVEREPIAPQGVSSFRIC